MTPGGGKLSGGIILAGWGEPEPSPPSCRHLARPGPESCLTQAELDSFSMSFTKQILSGKPSLRRKPVLVSRVRSEPWRPAGSGNNDRALSQASRPGDPFCSVCVNENLSEAEVELRREMEREVKLIQSKPSVAYRKHSPSNWSQDNMMDDVKKHKKLQKMKLEELKKEYAEIEKRCKSKLIDDLAGFEYKESEDRVDVGNKADGSKKKTIKSKSINIEILEDGTVKTSKIIKSRSDPTPRRCEEDDDSVAKSITISINSKSSRQGQQDCRKKEGNKKVGDSAIDRITSDDEDCDTLNAVENLSLHEAETSQSLLLEENNSIKNENEALRKKYKKYKTLKGKVAQSNIESDRQKSELRSLKAEMVRLVEENSQLRSEISHQQQAERKLTRQHSIFETPVRDVTYQDQAVQASVLNTKIQSFEIDYFTEVIIDELKKEIRELKDRVDTTSNIGKDQNDFKVQEQNFLSKLTKMKADTEKMKAAASKSQELTSDSSEVEKLKVEAENLRLLLSQERDTTATFESYLSLLRQSYTAMFGDFN